MKTTAVLCVGLAWVLGACSSSSSAPAGTGGATGGQAGGAAGAPAQGGAPGGGNGGGTAGARGGNGGNGGLTGGVACGADVCAAGEVCVHPNCVPGALLCNPVPDGGQCPSGWQLTNLCPSHMGAGCTPGPCTPPSPFCAPVPAACNGKPDCSCLPYGLCSERGGLGSCMWLNGSDVMCGAA
ncbi:MAG TPA: hypothetical protein VN962_20360 [Polyangia bacterium]|nr:hypothetical protein [Polyangia bacterium]